MAKLYRTPIFVYSRTMSTKHLLTRGKTMLILFLPECEQNMLPQQLEHTCNQGTYIHVMILCDYGNLHTTLAVGWRYSHTHGFQLTQEIGHSAARMLHTRSTGYWEEAG